MAKDKPQTRLINLTNKLALNAFAAGLIIICAYVFVGIGGTALNLAIPIGAFLVAGFFFGRSYPKVFLQVAIILASPIIILVIAFTIKADLDKQSVIEALSAVLIVTSISILGSFIGKKTMQNKRKGTT